MLKAHLNTPFVHFYLKFWNSQWKAVHCWTPSTISRCCYFLKMIILELPGVKAGETFRSVARGSLEPGNLCGPRLCFVSSTLQQLYSLRQAALYSFSFALLSTSHNSIRICQIICITLQQWDLWIPDWCQIKNPVWEQVGVSTNNLDTH